MPSSPFPSSSSSICCSETWSWDVRTKNVTYEPVPTIEHVQAIAAYGPTATLFTIGPSSSIQQYDLERSQMIANVRFLPPSIAGTPFEEDTMGPSTSEEDLQATLTHNAALEVQDLVSRPSDEHGTYHADQTQESQINPTITTFSMGTTESLHEAAQTTTGTTLTQGYPKSVRSATSRTSKSQRKSRLRQEVLQSPNKGDLEDLFYYIRARLSDVPYQKAPLLNETNLTSDDLRKQMLSVVFGWNEDIRDLIRDELSRHPRGSRASVYLSKWLNEDPDYLPTLLSSNEAPEQDWFLLSLSLLTPKSNKRTAQAFAEKMLNQGDAHTAATVLHAIGDRNEAIEVYVSRNCFMEAILLTCLATPHDWQRQSWLVRKWGEHVVQNSQQQLAIRCFSCTGFEPSEQWASPMSLLNSPSSHLGVTFDPLETFNNPAPAPVKTSSFRDAQTPIAMPPPPTPLRTNLAANLRMTTKNSALKLITSFEPNPTYKFPGLKSDENRTPTNGTITPIAESSFPKSAMSPSGYGSFRHPMMRNLNSLLSPRPGTAGGLHRARLPSIGETPVDVSPPAFPIIKPKPTPSLDPTTKEEPEPQTSAEPVQPSAPAQDAQPIQPTPPQPSQPVQSPQPANLTQTIQVPMEKPEPPPLILPSARYQPSGDAVKETPLTALAPKAGFNSVWSRSLRPASPIVEDGNKSEGRSRTGSRSRKPDGLSIQALPIQESASNDSGTDTQAKGSNLQQPDTAGSAAASSYLESLEDLTSPPTTGNSTRSFKSPSVSGRSLDRYISSLDEAQHYSQLQRSRTPQSLRNPSRDKARTKHAEKGDVDRKSIPRAKRSPSSPIPMSPADLRLYSASVESFASAYQSHSSATDGRSIQRPSSHRSSSKGRSKRRHRSQSRPGNATDVNGEPTPTRQRGRSKSRRADSNSDSPVSPLPLEPSEEDRQKLDDIDPALKLVAQQRELRQRSGSRRDRHASRDASPDHRKHTKQAGSRRTSVGSRTDRPTSRRQAEEANDPLGEIGHLESLASLPSTKYDPSATVKEGGSATAPPSDTERLKKEIAAAELEARRLSLARRPSAPSIPFPGQSSNQLQTQPTGNGRSSSRGRVENGAYLHNTHTGDSTASSEPSPTKIPTASESQSSKTVNGHSSSRGTPRAMPYPSRGQDPNIPDIPDHLEPLLNNTVYLPNADGGHRSTSAPTMDLGIHSIPPQDLPRHPAFDHRITASRSSSRNRAPSHERGTSRDRSRRAFNDAAVAEGSRDPAIHPMNAIPPPLLPELQHLANPPPPPPPPLHLLSGTLAAEFPNDTKGRQAFRTGDNQLDSLPAKLSVKTDLGQNPTRPVLRSTLSDGSNTSGAPQHRRGRSQNENLIGKVRNIAGRMRSTSHGRADNASKSPALSSDNTISPYESIPTPGTAIKPHTSPQITHSPDMNRLKDNAARHASEAAQMFSPYESIIPPNATVHPHMSPSLGQL